MKVFSKILAGSAAAAALTVAAPAAAQYYPGYPGGQGYPGPSYPGNPGYGYGYGGGDTSQALVNQCVAAVQQRLSGGYGYEGNGYGGGYGGGRVLGISRVEPRREGGFNVRGVASSGQYGGYGYGYGGGYGGEPRPDLTWKCKIDYRGYIIGLDINRAQPNYGYGNTAPPQEYTPYGNDYSQYGYRRY